MELEDRIRRCNQEADQAWADAVKAGEITPRKARTLHRPIVSITPISKDGRPSPVAIHRLRQAAALLRGKRNPQLLFDLALSHASCKKRDFPKRGLAKYADDAVWRIFQQHGEVPLDCPGFDYMPKAERGKLELRLYHHWPTVEKLASAFQGRTSRASNARRKPVKSFIRALQPMQGKTKP